MYCNISRTKNYQLLFSILLRDGIFITDKYTVLIGPVAVSKSLWIFTVQMDTFIISSVCISKWSEVYSRKNSKTVINTLGITTSSIFNVPEFHLRACPSSATVFHVTFKLDSLWLQKAHLMYIRTWQVSICGDSLWGDGENLYGQICQSHTTCARPKDGWGEGGRLTRLTDTCLEKREDG